MLTQMFKSSATGQGFFMTSCRVWRFFYGIHRQPWVVSGIFAIVAVMLSSWFKHKDQLKLGQRIAWAVFLCCSLAVYGCIYSKRRVLP